MRANGKSPLALDDPGLYFNRELSWLEFNRRVLEEAQDPCVPLLERVKFLAITESNLDEFFMVRVGGLQQKLQSHIDFGSGADRMPVKEQLQRIGSIVRQLNEDAYHCLINELLPALEKEGIVIKSLKDLTEADRVYLGEVFHREIFPVLTPLAIDPGHPFPHLANKSLNLVVVLSRPSGHDRLFAVVQVPSVLARFFPLPDTKSKTPRHVFVALETIIRLHLPHLFPGIQIEHHAVFRVTRNSDFEIDDDEVEDLLKTIEEEVRKRRLGAAVRLQIEAQALPEVEQFLTASLDLGKQDVTRSPRLLDLTGLFQICNLPGYSNLRDAPFVPQPVPEFSQAANLWQAIRTRDILVHHPYESFGHVVDFIDTAADDDCVLAVKLTLYRTSSDSPVVKALQRAADNGKQVTAVIELKARLDEERNILWARALEKAGVHVVFGFVGLKTHCKAALVVRREDDGIRRYVHLGTGNYNPQTAKVYTDLGYFTCNPAFCDDVSALFNYLTGYGELPQWQKIVVAPSRLQTSMIEKIDQERKVQESGGEGRIIAKVNGILEPEVIQALYRASQAGVKIDLICRGICALRPGVPRVSETIRVVSIVDRFLEHSRIFYFGNGGESQVYIGSADWMDRNLKRRVEVLFPIENPELKKRVVHEILAISLADNVKARQLLPDGSYRRIECDSGQERTRSQERFLEIASQNSSRSLLNSQHPEGPPKNSRIIGQRSPRKRKTR
jgi:polyphosphate kinase